MPLIFLRMLFVNVCNHFHVDVIINDATRYAQLLQERRKTAMTHTQSFVGEGFGEKYSEW